MENKISTWLSQLACLGVKTNCQREWVCERLARPRGGAVGGSSATVDVHLPAGGTRLPSWSRKRSKVERPAGVSGGHRAHLAAVTRRQANRFRVPSRMNSCSRRAGFAGRSRRPVASAPWPARRSFVDRDDQRPFGRIQVEPAHRGGFRVEVGAELAHHPLVQQMRLDLGPAQELVRRRLDIPTCSATRDASSARAEDPRCVSGRTRAGERDQARPHLRAGTSGRPPAIRNP